MRPFREKFMKSIYDYKVDDSQKNPVSLSDYKGKTLLIVNVASRCGLTPQYKGLQELYSKYSNKDFEILAFPCFATKGPITKIEARIVLTSSYLASGKRIFEEFISI